MVILQSSEKRYPVAGVSSISVTYYFPMKYIFIIQVGRTMFKNCFFLRGDPTVDAN